MYERYHIVKDEDQRAALARVEAGFVAIPHNSRTNGTNGVAGHVLAPSRERI